MVKARKSTTLWLLCLITLCIGMACLCDSGEEETPSRWEQEPGSTTEAVQPAERAEAPVVDEPEAVEGSALNKAFPSDGAEGYSRTFTQEKEGFAEAKFSKDGAEIVVTISDTAANPSARGKFSSAPDTIQGHPAMKQGNNGTVMLVDDRFQVKATSKTVDEAGRKALLEQADLSGLPK